MVEANVALHLKLTALVKPQDYQECLVYSPCEGFMVATWKELEGAEGFYLFAQYEPLDCRQAVFWVELPDARAMAALEQRMACQTLAFAQIVQRDIPSILLE